MQCQAHIRFLDPLRAHAGYEYYLRNRMKKAQRASMDWHKCLRSATHGEFCCQHAAYELLKSKELAA